MDDRAQRGKAVVVLIIFLAGFAAGALTIIAVFDVPPPWSSPSSNPIGHLESFSDDLDLSPDQKARMDAIVEHAGRRFHELRTTSEPKLRRIVEQAKTDIRKLLNAEQQKKFDKLARTMRRRFATFRMSLRQNFDGLSERFTKRLNLTDNQQEQIQPIVRDHVETQRDLLQGLATQGREGVSDLSSKLRELQKTTRKRLEQILTEEQIRKAMAIFAELKEEIRKKTAEPRE